MVDKMDKNYISRKRKSISQKQGEQYCESKGKSNKLRKLTDKEGNDIPLLNEENEEENNIVLNNKSLNQKDTLKITESKNSIENMPISSNDFSTVKTSEVTEISKKSFKFFFIK